MKRRREFEIEIAGRRIHLGQRTLILGVLNVTPDSFSDGGLYLDPVRAIQQGVELVRQGADWIDMGGESTRPGSHPITAEEELQRVLPVIRGLRRKLPSVPISIDTTKAEVAEQALRAGAGIVNDVSGLRFDPRLAEVVRRYRALLILMHLRGRPETMQQKPFARNIWRSLRSGFETSIRRALTAGVHQSKIILDPGLGFGKSRRQNYEILAGLERLQAYHLPILVGSSRKSFVQAVVAGQGFESSRRRGAAASRALLETLPGEQRPITTWPMAPAHPAKSRVARDAQWQKNVALLIGDAAAVVAAILGGAHIVRVHEPAAVLPAVRIADALLAILAGSGL